MKRFNSLEEVQKVGKYMNNTQLESQLYMVRQFMTQASFRAFTQEVQISLIILKAWKLIMQMIIQPSNVEYFFQTTSIMLFELIISSKILFNPQYHRHSQGTLQRMERYKFGYINAQKRPNSIISSDGKSQQPSQSPQKPRVQAKLTASVVKVMPDSSPQQKKQNSIQQQTGPLTSTKQTISQKITDSSSPQKSKDVKSVSQSEKQKDIKNIQAKNPITERGDFLKQQTQPHKNIPKAPKAQLLQSQSQSTLRTQYLMIPDPREVLKQQKLKQQRMMEEERIKQQEALVQRQTQSEIIFKSKPHNSFYENWKQQQQDPKSVIVKNLDNDQQQGFIKPANQFYEEWKRKQQEARKISQTIQEQDEESMNYSPNFKKSSDNRNFRDQQSNYSAKSIYSDELNLEVPIFITKQFPQISRSKSSSCIEPSQESPNKFF